MNTIIGFCWIKANSSFRKGKESDAELRNRCFLIVEDGIGIRPDKGIDILIELWEKDSTCYCRRTTFTSSNLLKSENLSLWFRNSCFPVKPEEGVVKEIEHDAQDLPQRIIVELNGQFVASLDYNCVKGTGVA